VCVFYAYVCVVCVLCLHQKCLRKKQSKHTLRAFPFTYPNHTHKSCLFFTHFACLMCGYVSSLGLVVARSVAGGHHLHVLVGQTNRPGMTQQRFEQLQDEHDEAVKD